MRGQRAVIGEIRTWIVQRSTKRGHVRVRNFIKVGCEAFPDSHHRGWMPLARHVWLSAHGAIPPQSEVIHKKPPPDMLQSDYVLGVNLPDPDIVDAIGNLMLVPLGGINEKINLRPALVRKHRKRRRDAVVKSNQQRGRIDGAMSVRLRAWYVLRTAEKLIVMRPYRTRAAATAENITAIGMEWDGVEIVRGLELFCEPYDGYRREVPGEISSDGNELQDAA